MRKPSVLILLMFFFLNWAACSRNSNDAGETKNCQRILFHIADFDSIILSSDRKIHFEFDLTNCTDTTFALFFLGVIEEGDGDTSFYMTNNISAGSAAFLTDKQGKHQKLEIIYAANYAPETFPKDSLVKWHIAQSLALRPKQSKRVKTTVELKSGFLAPGVYRLRFLYFAGDNVVNTIGDDVMENFLRTNQAHVFKGYVWSDTVTLIVEKDMTSLVPK